MFAGHSVIGGAPDFDVTQATFIKTVKRYNFVKVFGGALRVLDIGCGNCLGGRILKGFYKQFVNYDLGLEYLKYGRENFGEKGLFVCGDGAELPFRRGSFDLITALEVIEHLPRRCTSIFLEELKRVSARHATIIISTENATTYRKSGLPPSKYHINNFTPGRFKAVIREHLGPAEFYGFAPNYGTIRNLFRKADVFDFRYVLKKWFGVHTVEDHIEKTPASPDADPMAEALTRAGKMFRITKGDFKRGQGLIAVFEKEG